jgi:glycolate oxidase
MHSPQHSSSSLLGLFKPILPSASILHRPEELAPYECDGMMAVKTRPLLVLLPDSIAQVCAIMKICHARQIPVVARGAGTGLSGGAIPHAQGIVLSLARFNQIIEIDTSNCTARVQPGVRNLAITEAAKVHGLYYAPDPSSQIACSIGGNVAENAGGVHCLKYGLTVNNLLEMTFVTSQGEIVTVGSANLETAGMDLLALMTGSEGMLGIIVEILVKLLPQPTDIKVILSAFDDIEKAGDAVAKIIAAGIIPAGLEMMDNPSLVAAEDFAHAGYPRDAAAILLCELDGEADDIEADRQIVEALLRDSGAYDIRLAATATERLRFWAGRKAAFPAIGRISPDYLCMDGTIPRKHLSAVLQEIQRLSQEFGLAVANVFHAGDGNLHPLILYDANKPGELDSAEALGGKILETCVNYGGTITGEHGVGIEKINQMCIQFSPVELEIFHAVKAAFDEQGILNPGKVVPTLHRCAEFGAMHVHHGQLPHPELDRF